MFPWHRKSSVLKRSVRGCLTLTDHHQFEWAAKSPRKEMLILSISWGSSAHLQIRWPQSPPTSGSADTNNCANRLATYLHHSSSFHPLPDLISVTEMDGNNLMSNKSQLSQSERFTGAFVVHLKATRQPHLFFLFALFCCGRFPVASWRASRWSKVIFYVIQDVWPSHPYRHIEL